MKSISILTLILFALSNAALATPCPQKLSLDNFSYEINKTHPPVWVGNWRLDSDDISKGVHNTWKVINGVPLLVSVLDQLRVSAQFKKENKVRRGISCQYEVKALGNIVTYIYDYRNQELIKIPMQEKMVLVDGSGSLIGSKTNAKFYFQLDSFVDLPPQLYLNDDFYAITAHGVNLNELKVGQTLQGMTWHQVENDMVLLRLESSRTQFSLTGE